VLLSHFTDYANLGSFLGLIGEGMLKFILGSSYLSITSLHLAVTRNFEILVTEFGAKKRQFCSNCWQDRSPKILHALSPNPHMAVPQKTVKYQSICGFEFDCSLFSK